MKISNTKTLFLGRWKGYIILYTVYIIDDLRVPWFQIILGNLYIVMPFPELLHYIIVQHHFFPLVSATVVVSTPVSLLVADFDDHKRCQVLRSAGISQGIRILKMFMAQRQNQWSWMMFFVRELREHQLWERLLSHRFKHQRSVRGGASFYRYPVQYHPHGSRKWCKYHCWLVVYLPLWKIWKPVGIIIPNVWKNKKCSKPPTRLGGNQNHPKEPTGSVGKAAMAVSLPCKDSHGS